MGQILHGSAQRRRRSVERYNIVKRARGGACEALRLQPEDGRQVKRGPPFPTCRQDPSSPDRPSCQQEEEALVVAFRRHSLLPLDDCLYAPATTLIPQIWTRSSLHRCLQRHEISRLPQVEGEASAKRKRSRPIRSAKPISTSPRFELRKASSTSSSPSTERRSSPSSRCTRRWRAAPRGTSCAV